MPGGWRTALPSLGCDSRDNHREPLELRSSCGCRPTSPVLQPALLSGHITGRRTRGEDGVWELARGCLGRASGRRAQPCKGLHSRNTRRCQCDTRGPGWLLESSTPGRGIGAFVGLQRGSSEGLGHGESPSHSKHLLRFKHQVPPKLACEATEGSSEER